MRWRARAGLVAVILLASQAASAGICSLDPSPGATLLLPYFEVDLASPEGATTLFSVNNATAAATLFQVVLWSDLGVPTLGFSNYLTGYDVVTFNLRDLFNGVLPRTATASQDPQDTISPRGELSSDIAVSNCSGILPLPALPTSFVEHIRRAHTGQSSAIFNGCAGLRHGDNIARGYVTIDAVRSCTLSFPGDPGYFGEDGVVSDANVLWGDFFLVNPSQNSARGSRLVSLQADRLAFKPGDETFYGRFVNNSAADAREPLVNVWAARYAVGGPFADGGTDLLAWRNSGVANRPLPCGSLPTWYPLGQEHYQVFDEQENLDIPIPCGVGICPPQQAPTFLAGEANRFRVAETTPFAFGWLFMDLDIGGFPVRPSQAWVGTLMQANGRFGVGFDGTPLGSVCNRESQPTAPSL